MKRFSFLIIGLVMGLAIVLAAWTVADQNYTYQGVLIDPPIQSADFTLTDQNGSTFRLSEQRGKLVLIFFGFSNCLDVCPATLAEFVQIKAALGDQAANVRFVYITVDPERDTQQRMKTYLSAFDPEFIGLTGDSAALEAVWRSYGVYVERHNPDANGNYMVDHSSRTYLIDPQGNWRLNYPFGMEFEKISQDILHLLNSK